MPDERRHRGPHPEDRELFGLLLPHLQRAAPDYRWLLGRRYSANAALKLVGDRFGLERRQRLALMRAVAAPDTAFQRAERRVQRGGLRGAELWVDGFNVLTTVEAALAGGLVLDCDDGAFRDLASMHGSWKRVDETDIALRHIGEWLEHAGASRVHWLLDRPVSNSGRLAERMREAAAACGWPWQIELVDSPDRQLRAAPGTIATADSHVLVRDTRWVALAREVVEAAVPDAWIVGFDAPP